MDWNRIIGPLIAILVAIVLPLVLRKSKKGGAESREKLYQHLREMGLESSLINKGDDREKVGLGRSSGQKSDGIIKIEDKNIDSINVVSVSSQYGTSYFIDYLVKSPNIMAERSSKKTKLTQKKSSPFQGKVISIEWKGDQSLAQSLNLDYSLEDILLRSILSGFKGNILIFPEPKHGYTRIRTTYSLPSPEILKAMDIIARHIRSW